MSEYTTVERLRQEGLDPNKYSDAQLLRLIQRASMRIEMWTHRWFYPRALSLQLDGTGHDALLLSMPIISIASIRALSPDSFVIEGGADPVDLRSVRIYNRHLTQGLLLPDDRLSPKIQYLNSWTGTRRSPEIFPSGWFTIGVQNIEVNGLFGYTEPDFVTFADDGVTHVGKTPDAVSLACEMLVVRDLPALSDLDARNDAQLSSRVTMLRTRDQQINYNSSDSSSIATSFGSNILGNAEITSLLAPFCRGPQLGAV